MFSTQLHEMSLSQINKVLEGGNIKTYKRIDHARSALKNAIDSGELIYNGIAPFADDKKLNGTGKAPLKSKPRKSKSKTKKFIGGMKHTMKGARVFTRFGKHIIEDVGYYENAKDKIKAVLENGKIVSINSCRVSAVNPEYRNTYPVYDVKTRSGKNSIGIDDAITSGLLGVDIGILKKVCKQNKLKHDKWSHLNPGLQRMCIGNRLRGMARSGLPVSILETVISKGAN